LVKVEEELDSINILAELFDLEYVKSLVIESQVVGKLVEHSKEQVHWQQALHEIGLLAFLLSLNGNRLVLLVKDKVEAF